MKKSLALTMSAVVTSFLYLGCFGLNPTDEDSAKIILAKTADTVIAGQNLLISGSVEGSAPVSISYEISPAATGLNYSATTVSTKDVNLRNDANLMVTTTASTPSGNYTLTITAVVGTATTTKSMTIVVTGGAVVTQLSLDTFNLGSDNSSLPSFLDLDAGAAYTSSQVTVGTNLSTIDLCYFTSGASGTDDRFWSPKTAKDSAETLVNGTFPATVMASITTAEFDAVNSVEALTALWTAKAATAVTNITVTVGSCVIVRTTENMPVMVRVLAQLPGRDGNVEIKTAK